MRHWKITPMWRGNFGRLKMPSIRVMLCALAISLPGLIHAQGTATDAAQERQAGMKSADDALTVIKRAVDTGTDVETAGLYARAIADWARKMPTLFPPNSGRQAGMKTVALDEIWTDPAEFNRRAARLMDDAAALARALRGNDPSARPAAFAQTADACRSCHAKFRADF